MNTRRTHHAGLSLMECMFATAILSVAVVAVTESIMAGQAHGRHTVASAQAMALAEALMEEIVALPYRDPQGAAALGPDANETTRLLFDNSDDFHRYTEAPGEVRDAAGQLLPDEVQAFRRSVTGMYTTIAMPELAATIAGLNVRVTVTDGAETWTIDRFIPEPVE